MKRSTKQLLSALLVIAMMLSLLVVMPAAAADDVVHQITTNNSKDDDNTVKVGTDQSGGTAVAIESTDYDSEFFTDVANVTKHSNSGNTKIDYLIFAKAGSGKLSFTTTQAGAVVKMTIRGSKTEQPAPMGIQDSTGAWVKVTVEGEEKDYASSGDAAEFTWTLGAAGKYTVTPPTDSTMNRDTRLVSLTVTETAAEVVESPSAEASAPAESDPAESTPVESTPVESTPAESTPVESTPAESTPAESAPVASTPAESTPAESESPAPSTPVESDPPAAGDNEWVANVEDIKASNGDSLDVADELLVDTGVSGVKFYIGGGSPADDKAVNTYKLQDNSTESLPNAITAGVNPRVAKDAKTNPTAGNPVCVAGTYFKWVADSNGVLDVTGVVNGDKEVFIAKNGSCLDGWGGTKKDAKCQIDVTIPVASGDVIIYSLSGSKPMLAGFKFEEMKAEEYEWTANVEDIQTANGGSLDVADELLVGTNTPGMKFYIGGGSPADDKAVNTYKLQDNSTEGLPNAITAGVNPRVAKDAKTNPTAGNPVCVAGTYFKWVAEESGVLDITGVVNGDKEVFIAKNGSCLDGWGGTKKDAKCQIDVTVPVKSGDVVIYSLSGSKPMLAGFKFTKGNEVEEKDIDWTEANILTGSVSITGADKKDGSLVATVSGPRVGVWVNGTTAWNCADYMTIEMYNEAGELLDSVMTMDPGSVHTATFHPSLSGKYTFKAILSREDEADFTTAMSAAFDFVLPIPKPVVTVGVQAGGKLNVSWPRFVEATGYNLYMADSEAGLASAKAIELTTNEYTTDALTVGGTYYFQVETLRNAEKSAKSDAASGVASAEAKTIWDYTYYGVSTTAWSDKDDKGNDSTLFDVYPDGVIKMNDPTSFQIRSWGGSGKVQEGDQDGVSFVYTRVPASQNFTLRAKIKVEKWRYEGQEGMGLMATDALGSGNDLDKKNEANNVFVNNYMVGAMRFGNGSLGATFGKAFKGNKGVGMIQQVGNPNPAVKPSSWNYKQLNLDPYPENKGMTSGTYNILGNEIEVTDANTGVTQRGTVKAGFTQADPLVTEFDLVIERNNTGIYGYYYLPNGDIKIAKTYDRDALLQQDPDSMYVGFFAARHMVIQVSNVDLRVDDPENYPPKEVPDTTYITPRINVGSPLVSNSEEYNLILTSNVVGTATVTANGDTETVQLVKQREDDASTGATRYVTRGEVKVPVKNGTNVIQVSFQPAELADQGFAPYYDLLNTDAVKTSVSVTYQNKFAGRNNLYVSPTGKPGGYGTKEKPLDIYTAVKVAQPGQKVILMEGTYGLTTTVTIEKGISGTQEKPIYLMADPEAETRPVLDGSRLSTSSGIALKGDYWHFYNFVVRNCGGSGIAVNGNNNVIEYVDVVGNQNTGLQIARGGEVDGVLKYWPSNNLILNCLAMNNRDSSWGSADGFAAKLTSGTGNIFRYCVAAYNADDGWDLFAKSEDGPIGDVIIENCVVFKSGFGLDADGNEITDPNANGNGFKMGGSGVYGNHKVINSYAFYNKAKGVDSNSGPNTEAHNVVSFNNIGPNIRFYTNNDVPNTNYRVDNWISFKNDELKNVDYVNEGKSQNSYTTYDEIVAKGTQKKAKWQNATAYYWSNGATASTDGTIADPASLFVSTDLKDLVIGYNEDGNLCTGDFLKLKDSIPTGLKDVVPSTDPANYHSPENLMVMASNLSDPYCITPDAAFVVPSGGGGGGGGRDDRGDSSSSTAANRVNKRTNGNGDLVITVTDPTGDVLVDVTLPATVPTTDKKFVDVPDEHWAADAINEMAARGIVKGVDDENFDMVSDVTRGTLATMLYRLSNGKAGYPNAFSDVKEDSWYKDAVAWAAKVGVVNGYGDGTFAGDATITREQLALMLYRYAALLGMDTTATGDTSAFKDSAAVSSWAAEAMNWAVSSGIINGVGDNTLAPQASATRAQTALMLQRFIALVK